ncbi:hypothetical protein ACS0TY_025814 [Phlomoides rotata]
MYLLFLSPQLLQSPLLVLVEGLFMHLGVHCPLRLSKLLFLPKIGFFQNPLITTKKTVFGEQNGKGNPSPF